MSTADSFELLGLLMVGLAVIVFWLIRMIVGHVQALSERVTRLEERISHGAKH